MGSSAKKVNRNNVCGYDDKPYVHVPAYTLHCASRKKRVPLCGWYNIMKLGIVRWHASLILPRAPTPEVCVSVGELEFVVEYKYIHHVKSSV